MSIETPTSALNLTAAQIQNGRQKAQLGQLTLVDFLAQQHGRHPRDITRFLATQFQMPFWDSLQLSATTASFDRWPMGKAAVY